MSLSVPTPTTTFQRRNPRDRQPTFSETQSGRLAIETPLADPNQVESSPRPSSPETSPRHSPSPSNSDEVIPGNPSANLIDIMSAELFTKASQALLEGTSELTSDSDLEEIHRKKVMEGLAKEAEASMGAEDQGQTTQDILASLADEIAQCDAAIAAGVPVRFVHNTILVFLKGFLVRKMVWVESMVSRAHVCNYFLWTKICSQQSSS